MKLKESNMLTKLTFRTILFMAVLLLIIPMIMSADETEESNTFENQFLYLLQQIETGVLTQEKANEQIRSMGEEYSVSETKMELVLEMMNKFANGESTSEDCQEQLKTQEHSRLRVRIQTPDETPLILKTQASKSNATGKN